MVHKIVTKESIIILLEKKLKLEPWSAENLAPDLYAYMPRFPRSVLVCIFHLLVITP